MRTRLKERSPETADVMSFIFDLGGQKLEYRPGQILHYELDALAFPDERGNRRHFTISSSPTEEGLLVFTTRMRGRSLIVYVPQPVPAPLSRQMNFHHPER